MAYPKVSIIAPVYNVESYLHTCIDSVLGQKGEVDYELILVDDGSKDNSGKICDEYASQHSFIKVIHQRNSGPSATRNAGLDAATGEYILFVDSDDFVDIRLLSTCFSYIHNGQEPDMLQFAFSYTTEAGEPAGKVKGPRQTKLLIGGDEYGKGKNYRPFVWSFLIKRNLIENHQLRFAEDIRFAEDAHFVLRCLFFAESIQTISTPLYYYRQREGSLMAQKSNYTLAWYHIYVAELLITLFYKEKGGNFSVFFKKRVHQLAVVYLKRLSKLEYDKETIKRAQKDMEHFKEVCRENPGCITSGFALFCAKLYLPGYLMWKRMTHLRAMY